MAAIVELQPEFGYCMLVFVLSIVQLIWMSIKVVMARKKFDVQVRNLLHYYYEHITWPWRFCQ